MENPRQIAIRVLQQRKESGEFVEKLLDRELGRRPMAAPDRALCQELTYGIVRWQMTLDWLIARKTANRPQHPALRTLLQLGLYQLFWLQRIPNHAAVHETVEVAKRLGFEAKAGFLNAILRGYTRERDATLAELEQLKGTDLALGFSHPKWLVDRWLAQWGKEKTIQLLQWNNSPPPVYARANLLKTDRAALAKVWEQEGVEFREATWDWNCGHVVFKLESHPPFASCQSFQEGFFYVQDPSTLLAVTELDPQPQEHILDACAAPGGKTACIAERMGNQGHIEARDIQPERLKLVEENCVRLGVTCVSLQPSGQPTPFDRILVDAPCSNTGVMRRRVDLRWRITAEEIERLKNAQHELLVKAAGQLQAGGILVYSTCSLEPEENEAVIREFLQAHPQFVLERARQLLPFVDGVDGAYVARFRKTS